MYAESPPPPRLSGVLRCLWRSSVGRQLVVPDGCLDLVVAGDEVFVAGPDTRPWRSALGEGTVVHGARFRPGHAPRVLGVPADELANRRVPLDELWGRRGRTVTDLLLHRAAALPDVVARHATGMPDAELAVLLARLDRGAPRVSAALTGLGVGERQLRRRFTAAVGYGPATYLRVARLQRALSRAPRIRELARLAVAAGYADQAHMSRDCRELTGCTPGEFFGTR
ncbi:AraC family transcriptional regulator [Prauserella shujinwangii]|uniref:AraC family transcriptional regulator n=1 Tax=Prauserella shujinwangii TaxID=1453103 RepID=A0A2T0LST1_9PSEU|nr:helix-turn-helix transcriptional regulator [Prauserella shujinwangii]PRX46730.1 AraC family transcriptional regulator [Prauserella shujinwangii]